MGTQTLALRNNETARVEFLKKISVSQFKLIELGKLLNLSSRPETGLAKMEARGRAELTDAFEKVEQLAKTNVV